MLEMKGDTMTRQEIENVQIGQTGLYPWDKSLPVCRIGELREILAGPGKGEVFRYIEVERPTATIGFTISTEGDKQ
jgi:hypothetical protein